MVVGFFFECVFAHTCERERFKRHTEGRRSYFSGRFFALAILLHSLNADLSLDLEHTTKLRERECYFIRARLLFLSVLFYTNAAPQV